VTRRNLPSTTSEAVEESSSEVNETQLAGGGKKDSVTIGHEERSRGVEREKQKDAISPTFPAQNRFLQGERQRKISANKEKVKTLQLSHGRKIGSGDFRREL